jgi:ankyrin repeat protein
MPEKYSETCQWNIPSEWDGEFWKLKSLGGPPPTTNNNNNSESSLDSGYRYHTGDSIGAAPGIAGNPRLTPAHLQNISLIYNKQQQQQAHNNNNNNNNYGGFAEPGSDWHPGHSQPPLHPNHNNNNNHHHKTSVFTDSINLDNSTLLPPTTVHPTHYQSTHHLSQRSDYSNNSSQDADHSVIDSLAPTIDTVNLQHIAEQLISSDEIIMILAKRLGLDSNQIIPAEELSSVFSVRSSESNFNFHPTYNNNNKNNNKNNNSSKIAQDLMLLAPRADYIAPITPVNNNNNNSSAANFLLSSTNQEMELTGGIGDDEDDDLWSADGDIDVIGDVDYMKELGAESLLPRSQLHAAQLQRQERLANLPIEQQQKLLNLQNNKKKKNTGDDLPSVVSQIPYLDLSEVVGQQSNNEIETNEKKYAWRRLPRPRLQGNQFLAQALKTHVMSPKDMQEGSVVNSLNRPIFLSIIHPLDACQYEPSKFETAFESIFIPDCKRDMERAVATLRRNIEREQELNRAVPTDDLLLFGEAKEFTSVEEFLMKQYKHDQAQVGDPQEAAKERALLAAKASNIAEMEDCLAEDINIDTADTFGNSLLLLAAQQGSRRMCKFLLRRGANINFQNLSGNTALHYCYAYGNKDLGEYLKSKGANDAIVNVDGLTCYEGLSREAVAEFYGDYEENDFENAGQVGDETAGTQAVANTGQLGDYQSLDGSFDPEFS